MSPTLFAYLCIAEFVLVLSVIYYGQYKEFLDLQHAQSVYQREVKKNIEYLRAMHK